MLVEETEEKRKRKERLVKYLWERGERRQWYEFCGRDEKGETGMSLVGENEEDGI